MRSLRISMQEHSVGVLSIDANENYAFEYDSKWQEEGVSGNS